MNDYPKWGFEEQETGDTDVMLMDFLGAKFMYLRTECEHVGVPDAVSRAELAAKLRCIANLLESDTQMIPRDTVVS